MRVAHTAELCMMMHMPERDATIKGTGRQVRQFGMKGKALDARDIGFSKGPLENGMFGRKGSIVVVVSVVVVVAVATLAPRLG